MYSENFEALASLDHTFTVGVGLWLVEVLVPVLRIFSKIGFC